MSEIVEKTERFVSELLTEKLDSRFVYHNLRHTQRVVKSTKELLNYYKLEGVENERLLLAAWFHDVGHTKGWEHHEENSCEIARDFLSKNDYDPEGIEQVCSLIMVTKMCNEPTNLMEGIIRDADISHFAKKSYWETTDFLKEELRELGIADYSAKEWRDKNIKMFRTKHNFFTDYAKENWEEGKQQNLKKLLKEKKEEKKIAKKEALKAKYKSESPDRSVQTLYRVTLRNHLKLSDIADTKANILLSVNAIIISLVLANLLTKLDNPSNTYMIYPTFILIMFSVVSMVLSVLATRPNITSGKFTKEDVEKKRVNLLFFGNFHKMELEEYEWALQELVKDKDYVYSSLTKDLYYLGIVLNRKYKILRITYNIFMIGMIISVISFGIAFRFFGPDRLMF
ncbi:metal-dependent phosphohydrolase HD sub domain protein [Allomuricauda ruestringensis DSM 13258]|uniref:Metal-dependent phosphohydrolase HD sub domain protein n=1 Tax=Allomuricauda ruestringensis (strain DSM 13258 / CIP 107369 / LMG 19739 / B1) TaxID=886377 RepID=G2PLH8_ALLRU|nr:Pycsar system effector family protein [Allomuricauda ruestringensis]AEM70010.1 metal-dependent phosphohydrolase HD sub domain protein [Allomuricauda ruestringensis DSM 13258]